MKYNLFITEHCLIEVHDEEDLKRIIKSLKQDSNILSFGYFKVQEVKK